MAEREQPETGGQDLPKKQKRGRSGEGPEPERPETPQEEADSAVHQLNDPPQAEGGRREAQDRP